MSQNKIEDIETRDSESEQIKYPLTYPEDDWFFVTMIVLSVLTLIGYIVVYIIKSYQSWLFGKRFYQFSRLKLVFIYKIY